MSNTEIMKVSRCMGFKLESHVFFLLVIQTEGEWCTMNIYTLREDSYILKTTSLDKALQLGRKMFQIRSPFCPLTDRMKKHTRWKGGEIMAFEYLIQVKNYGVYGIFFCASFLSSNRSNSNVWI
jgi:hypothetical protein